MHLKTLNLMPPKPSSHTTPNSRYYTAQSLNLSYAQDYSKCSLVHLQDSRPYYSQTLIHSRTLNLIPPKPLTQLQILALNTSWTLNRATTWLLRTQKLSIVWLQEFSYNSKFLPLHSLPINCALHHNFYGAGCNSERFLVIKEFFQKHYETGV